MTPEIKLLFSLLRSYIRKDHEREPLIHLLKKTNFNRFISKCFAHSLEGIVYYELSRLGLLEHIEMEYNKKLHWGARNTLMVNMFMTGEFKKLIALLSDKGIEAIPVKGIIFANTLYNDLSLRPMADIDILVKEVDYLKAINELKKNAYSESTFIPERKWERENFRIALTKLDMIPFTVEIHKRLSHPHRFDLSIQDVLEHLTETEICGMRIRTPDDNYTFLLMLHHMGMHYFNIKLLWLIDMLKFVFKTRLEWGKILEYVEKYKMKNIFYMARYLTSRYDIFKVDSSYQGSPGRTMRIYLKGLFSPDYPNFFRFSFLPLRLSQILCGIPLIDNWEDRFLFIKNYLRVRAEDFK